MKSKNEVRRRRHNRLRKRVEGTSERPRLAVFRSAKHIYAQVIDDLGNKVLVAACDAGKAEREAGKGKKKKERAKMVGVAVAKKCIEKGIAKVVFDRGGYQYHGRVSAVADGAREAGLKF